MASLSCCTSRQPPSPDGPPPRLVESPPKSSQAMPNDYLPEKNRPSVSRLSSHEDIAEHQGIFEDKSDTDEEGLGLTVKKSSSTLNAMKTKLRQHLSRDSATSKRQSRSVGTSEEEVERRRELRRLNRKRIQEELSNEGVYDDDAKSLSTFATTNNLHTNPTISSQENEGALSPLIPLPNFSNGATKPAYSQLSRSGDPFEVVNSLYLSKRRSQAWTIDSKQLSITRRQSLQRRHSSVELCRLRSPELSSPILSPQGQSPARVVPPAPVLRPQRLPSIADSASRRTSWRLSFASERRSSQLRALIQEQKTSDISTDGSGKKIASALWLWSRPSSQAVTDPPENSIGLEASALCSVLRNATKDFGGVDGNADLNLHPIHLQEMRIPQRLASRGLYSHSSSLQLSSCGSHGQHEGSSHSTDCLREKCLKHSGIQHNCIKANVSSVQSKFSYDDSSSLYSAGHKSMQSISQTSRFNLASLLSPESSGVADRSSDSGDPLTISIPPKLNPGTRPKAHALASKFNFTSVGNHRPSTMVDSIITSGVCGPETGPNSADASISKSNERHCPSTPVQSKFREEFDEPQTAPQNKSSILSTIQIPRLTKLSTKSYDDSGSVELQIPGHRGYGYPNRGRIASTLRLERRTPAVGPPETNGISSVIMLESAEELWSRALKRNQEERAQIISGQAQRNKELEKKEESRRSFIAFKRLSWNLKGKGGRMIDAKQEEVVDKSLAPDEQDKTLERIKLLEMQREKESENIEAWTSELRFREEEARTKSIAARGRPQRRALVTPESWARFPSHTRSERNDITGPSDGVSQQDFAIKYNSDGRIEWWTGERKHHHDHDRSKEHNSKLSAQLSKKVRASLYKLRTSKSSLTNDSLQGRKSSISVGGILEFPELEIIASRDPREMEWEEMQKEVAADLRLRERAARMIAITDGSQDEGRSRFELDLDETAKINIADPRFYEDCLITIQSADPADRDSKSEATVVIDRLEGPVKAGGGSTNTKKSIP